MALNACGPSCECGTLLLQASEIEGNLAEVKKLLNHGADVRKTNSQGDTPLHRAVINKKNFEVVKELLKNGACVDALNNFNDTPLHLLVESKGNPETVNLLLKNGACVKKRNRDGYTPLHYALMYRCDDEIVTQLLQHGACVHAADDIGDTALHFLALVDGNPEFATEFVKRGADIRKPNCIGTTPLGLAVGLGHFKVFKELLKYEAPGYVELDTGHTLLHLAATEPSNLDIVKELLKFGVDLSVLDISGQTALHEAARHEDNAQVVEELLRHGALALIADEFGDTPVDFAKGIMELQLLIKYALIQGFEGDYSQLFNSEQYGKWKDNTTLARFFDDCVSEVVQMKQMMVNTRVSLYKLVTAKTNVALYPDNEAVRNITGEALISNYPIYNDVITSKIKCASERATLVNKFVYICASILKKDLEKKNVLNYDCLSLLTEFLSIEDIRRFISTFRNSAEDTNECPVSSNYPDTSWKRQNPETGFEETRMKICTKKIRVE